MDLDIYVLYTKDDVITAFTSFNDAYEFGKVVARPSENIKMKRVSTRIPQDIMDKDTNRPMYTYNDVLAEIFKMNLSATFKKILLQKVPVEAASEYYHSIILAVNEAKTSYSEAASLIDTVNDQYGV